MTAPEYRNRIALLKKELSGRRLDSLLVTDDTNVSYMSGFTGHDSMLLVTRGDDFFITDSRYLEEAQGSIRHFDIRLVEVSAFDTILRVVKKARLKNVGFESMDLPCAVAGRLKKILKSVTLTGQKDIVENLRAVKDRGEIALIKNSIRLTRKVLGALTGMARPGISEKTLAKRCEIAFIEAGAKAAFEPIVATGANASRPHSRPTDGTIQKDSFVMIDIGCCLQGYCSDMTRVVTLGRVKEKFRKMYSTVRAAQEIAIGKVGPGARASDVDSAARSLIERHGFGKYFGHSVGHGVGMKVHEGPSISRISRTRLVPGMVFTVEPAIYVPKFGGVRIEDMVLVTDRGCEVLTR